MNETHDKLEQKDLDDDEKQELNCLALSTQLRRSIEDFFPVADNDKPTCLYYADLSWHKILADEDKSLTAVWIGSV